MPRRVCSVQCVQLAERTREACKVMFELGESLGQCDHHHCQEFNMPKLKSSFIPFAHCDCFHGFAVKKCIKPQKVEPFFGEFCLQFRKCQTHTRTSLFAYFIKTHIRKTNGYFALSVCKFTHIASVCVCLARNTWLWLELVLFRQSRAWPCLTPGARLPAGSLCVCCLFYGQSNMQTEGSDCVVVGGRGQGSVTLLHPLFLPVTRRSLVAIEFHLHNFNVCESKLT